MSKVLVVDDDQDLLFTLKTILTDNNFIVETVSESNEIYPAILSFDPEIILLDVHLKDDDGRNICQGLKNHFRTKEIPVILCSGFENIEKEFKDYKADDFFKKPFEIDKLIKRLKDFSIMHQ